MLAAGVGLAGGQPAEAIAGVVVVHSRSRLVAQAPAAGILAALQQPQPQRCRVVQRPVVATDCFTATDRIIGATVAL